MNDFSLFASPWWVNLLVTVPFIAYYFWRRRGGLDIAKQTLLVTAIFAVAFGFVEAAVVIHLRAAVGFLPGYHGTLSDVARLSSSAGQVNSLNNLPQSLFVVEFFREIATMVMLACVALLAVPERREPRPFGGAPKGRGAAIFLWTFALWDIFYYAWLYVLIRWPQSLTTPDVLFLVPVPWYAQVWFPILVSFLTLIAVLLATRKTGKNLQ